MSPCFPFKFFNGNLSKCTESRRFPEQKLGPDLDVSCWLWGLVWSLAFSSTGPGGGSSVLPRPPAAPGVTALRAETCRGSWFSGLLRAWHPLFLWPERCPHDP